MELFETFSSEKHILHVAHIKNRLRSEEDSGCNSDDHDFLQADFSMLSGIFCQASNEVYIAFCIVHAFQNCSIPILFLQSE